jgi:acyl-CoA synthetase (AMP-forming)/AMP-acid ligase II
MRPQTLRHELRQRLQRNRERVLLRVVPQNETVAAELTGKEILEQAEAIAARCSAAAPREVVLLLLPHSLELFLLHIGLVLSDRVPAILPWPTTRVDPEKYQRNLLHQLGNLPADELVTTPSLVADLGAGLPFPVRPCDIDGAARFESAVPESAAKDILQARDAAPQRNREALFLQFSGGTTGTQKCVVVTGEMLVEQLDRLQTVLAFSEEDGVGSWLPLYHDMGLIACLWLPLWAGAPSVHISATDWLFRPEMLLQNMDRYHATFCWMPNFGFSYMAKARGRMEGTYALDHTRAWINCSEPVRLRSFDRFAEAFADWGVRPTALQASYAMAENVFAVTQTTLGCLPATYKRHELDHAAQRYTSRAFELLDDVYVSSGKLLPGMELKITGPSGEHRDDAQPGEIQIRTTSLFHGYWGRDGYVRHSLSRDGWYATGDYGFTVADELFVVGRIKDIIVVAGQNIFPEDVEAVVNTIQEVYPGRAVAFGVEDEQYHTQNLAVVAELRGTFDRQRADAVGQLMKRLITAVLGIPPRYTVAVPERWIVKSTAGKISRQDTRTRFTTEFLEKKVFHSMLCALVEPLLERIQLLNCMPL